MQLPSQVPLKWCFSHTGLVSGYLNIQGSSNHRAFALTILSCLENFFFFLWQCTCFSGGSHSEESACNAGNPGSIPGLGRYPGEGNGYPLQYPCLKNSMDRGAWLQSMGSQRVRHDWATNTFTLPHYAWLLFLSSSLCRNVPSFERPPPDHTT